MFWKPVFALSTFAAVVVLMTTAADYQRLSQKRHQERQVMRHLVAEILPRLTARLDSLAPRRDIRFLPFVGDEEGLAVSELASALRGAGWTVDAPHPLLSNYGVDVLGWTTLRNERPHELLACGIVTESPRSNPNAPQLALTFQVARSNETKPLAEFSHAGSADAERLATVFEQDRVVLVPAAVPLFGGQRVSIDAPLFLGVLLLATVVGMIVDLSGWTWLQGLKAAVYVALGLAFLNGWLSANSQAGLLLWAVIYSSALFHYKDEGKAREGHENSSRK